MLTVRVKKFQKVPICTSGFSMQWHHNVINQKVKKKILKTPAYLVSLVSIFQSEQKSLWDLGPEMKSSNVSGDQC